MTADPPVGTGTATTDVGADGGGLMTTEIEVDLGDVPVVLVADTANA